jgi:hypothetical protein
LLLAIKPFQKLEELLHSLKQQKVVIRGNFTARERGEFSTQQEMDYSFCLNKTPPGIKLTILLLN